MLQLYEALTGQRADQTQATGMYGANVVYAQQIADQTIAVLEATKANQQQAEDTRALRREVAQITKALETARDVRQQDQPRRPRRQGEEPDVTCSRHPRSPPTRPG